MKEAINFVLPYPLLLMSLVWLFTMLGLAVISSIFDSYFLMAFFGAVVVFQDVMPFNVTSSRQCYFKLSFWFIKVLNFELQTSVGNWIRFKLLAKLGLLSANLELC